MARQFWLSDAQWAVIEPLLPHLGGKPRVDDRRVISGILHRYREGLCWRAVLAALVACEDPPDTAMVDSTAVRAHRSAAGAKGGSKIRPSAGRAADPQPRSTRSVTAMAASMP